jgi:hypothetical protein
MLPSGAKATAHFRKLFTPVTHRPTVRTCAREKIPYFPQLTVQNRENARRRVRRQIDFPILARQEPGKIKL